MIFWGTPFLTHYRRHMIMFPQGRDAVVRLSGRATVDAEAQVPQERGRYPAEPGQESRPGAEKEHLEVKLMVNWRSVITS